MQMVISFVITLHLCATVINVEKAFLTDKEIDLVLNRLAVVSVTQNINSIKLNNGIIRKQPHCTYLFVPTLGPESVLTESFDRTPRFST